MSTATAPANPSVTDSTAAADRDRGDRLIGQHLEAARAALWRAALLSSVLQVVGVLLAACLAFVVVDQWIWSFGTAGRVLMFAAGVAVAAAWFVLRILPLLRMRVSPEYAAYSLEHDAPELRHALSSYVTLRPDRDAPGLRGIVVRSIGVQAARHLTSTGMAMPTEAGGTFKTALRVIVVFAVLALYAALSPKNTLQSFGRLMLPFSSIDPPTRVSISEVSPGATEALFGRPLEVTARIRGLIGSDAPRILVAGENPLEIPLQTAGGTERFSGEIPGRWISHTFEYSVVAGDASRGPFEVLVRDEPTVMVQAVAYAPHPYTKLPERSSSSGAIDGVEGTRVTVTATGNRPLKRGRIEFNPRTTAGRTSPTAGIAPLEISADGRTVSATWNLRTGHRSGAAAEIDSYRLRIWDDTETTNSDPIVYPIRVQPDLAPEVRIAVPAEWPKDVPLGTQQLIEVRALDPDFGLTGVRLRIRRGTLLLADPLLIESAEGLSGSQVALYRFRPDSLGLRPGETVTVEAIATDNRTTVAGDQPDPNVTTSDPVELRIVATPPQRQPIEDGDGLQPKDQQPAVESQQQPNESGESQSGEGQSGEGQSGEGQSGEGQSGEGQSGEGQSGEGQSGEGQSGEGQSGEGQSGEGQSGEGQSGEGQSGEGQSGEGQSGEGQPGTGASEGGGQTASSSGAGSPGSGENAGGASEGGASESDPASGSPSTAGGANGSPSTGGASTEGEPSRRPASTDGEAFDRIQEYLREKQQAQNSDGGNGAAGQPTSSPNAPGSGESQPANGESPSSSAPESPTGASAQDDSGSRGADDGDSGEPTGQGEPTDNGTAASRSGGTDPIARPDGPPQSGAAGSSADQQPDGATPEDGSARASDTGRPEGSEPGDSPQPGSGGQSEDGGPAEVPRTDEAAPGEASGNGESQGDGQAQGDGESPRGSEAQGDQATQEDTAGQSGDPARGEGTPAVPPAAAQPDDGAAAGSGNPSTGSPQPDGSPSGDPTAGDNAGQPEAESQPDSAAPQGEPTAQPSGNPGAGRQPPGGSPRPTGGTGPQAGQPGPQNGQANPQSGPEGTPAEGTPPGADSLPTGASQQSSTATPSGPGAPAGSMGGTGQSSTDDPPPGVEAPPAPDPVNPEYARRSTDLVLDALKNQRETPDPELLDELGWTADQYRRFIDRWEQARRLADNGDAAAQRDFEESLRSLGLRPPQTNQTRKLESRSDDLGTLRDAGSRVPPPPQFREAFEAFRRTVNQPSRSQP